MEEEGKFRVEKFNSQNFQLWKMQMEDYLCQKDNTYRWMEKQDNEEWEVLDRKALGTIQFFLSWLVAFNISK